VTQAFNIVVHYLIYSLRSALPVDKTFFMTVSGTLHLTPAFSNISATEPPNQGPYTTVKVHDYGDGLVEVGWSRVEERRKRSSKGRKREKKKREEMGGSVSGGQGGC
jgi:hypothetical protein